MQQVSAIEARHRQWIPPPDELTARDHGESIIQLWDNLLPGDPFDMLAMPVESLQLGQAQPAEEWESGIRRTGLTKGGRFGRRAICPGAWPMEDRRLGAQAE